MKLKRWDDGAVSLRIGRRFQIVYERKSSIKWAPLNAHVIAIGKSRRVWFTDA